MFHGLVLRIQVTSHMQRMRRTPEFMITPGDVDDRKPLEYKAFVEFIYGKLVGDKGYIGKNLLRDCSWTAYNL